MGDSVLLYEGKAKKMFSTDNKDEVRVYFKDDATAGNGAKKGQIDKKGVLNNSYNAGMLAVQILSLKYLELKDKLINYREEMKEKFISENEEKFEF